MEAFVLALAGPASGRRIPPQAEAGSAGWFDGGGGAGGGDSGGGS